MTSDKKSGKQTNQPNNNEAELPDAIKAAAVAINLCLSNKFGKAQAKLAPWADKSMYHALGYGTIMFLQAVMTFERRAIEEACEAIKNGLEVTDRYRKHLSWSESFTSIFWKTSYSELTEVELHAELVYAECLLQRSILMFIEDESMLSLIKGALKIRACYQTYRTCQEMLQDKIHKHEMTGQMSDFQGGVHLGIGAFNLLLSMLPQRVLRLLEWVGFSGDKYLGLEELTMGCDSESLRSPISAMVLLGYHSVVTYYLGNGEGDIEYSEKILQPCLRDFPKGAIFLYYAGRLKQCQGDLKNAIVWYNNSIKSQSEWKQFHHICYWELMFCYGFCNDWKQAFHYVELLSKESHWSKASYSYMMGAYRVMMRITEQEPTDNLGEDDPVDEYFKNVPIFKQRIAGKSLPFEKFAVEKSSRYFQQGRRLMLPGLEVIYIWNGFRILAKRPDLLRTILQVVEKAMDKLGDVKPHAESNSDSPGRVDDWCLGTLLRGMCLRYLEQIEQAKDCFRNVLARADSLQWDHYLIPYSCAEIGFTHLIQGHLDEAERFLKMAERNYTHYKLENRLHFRIHSALQDIEHRRKTPTPKTPERPLANGVASPLDTGSAHSSTDSLEFVQAMDQFSPSLAIRMENNAPQVDGGPANGQVLNQTVASKTKNEPKLIHNPIKSVKSTSKSNQHSPAKNMVRVVHRSNPPSQTNGDSQHTSPLTLYESSV